MLWPGTSAANPALLHFRVDFQASAQAAICPTGH